jgi:hypothetical protein
MFILVDEIGRCLTNRHGDTSPVRDDAMMFDDIHEVDELIAELKIRGMEFFLDEV